MSQRWARLSVQEALGPSQQQNRETNNVNSILLGTPGHSLVEARKWGSPRERGAFDCLWLPLKIKEILGGGGRARKGMKGPVHAPWVSRAGPCSTARSRDDLISILTHPLKPRSSLTPTREPDQSHISHLQSGPGGHLLKTVLGDHPPGRGVGSCALLRWPPRQPLREQEERR